MPDPRTRKRALWLAPETSYATDPTSGYLAVPVMELGEISDNKVVIETNRFTGRVGATSRIAGPDSATFSFDVEALPFSTAADSDGDSPPTADYLDELLAGVGEQTSDDAEDVNSQSGTSLSMASDLYDAGDLLLVQRNSEPPVAVPITADAGSGSYTLAYEPYSGSSATLVRGVRRWTDDQGTDATQTFTAVYEQDSTQYTLVGCRATSCTLSVPPDQQARFSFEMFADAQETTTKSGLADQTGDTATTPLKNGQVWVDGTQVEVSSLEIDFGIDAQPRVAVDRANGRSDHLQVSTAPTITITPIFTDALLQLKRAQTEQSIVVQVGLGDGNIAFYAPVCQVSEANRQDENGLQRISLQFTVLDPGADLPRWQVVRG